MTEAFRARRAQDGGEAAGLGDRAADNPPPPPPQLGTGGSGGERRRGNAARQGNALEPCARAQGGRARARETAHPPRPKRKRAAGVAPKRSAEAFQSPTPPAERPDAEAPLGLGIRPKSDPDRRSHPCKPQANGVAATAPPTACPDDRQTDTRKRPGRSCNRGRQTPSIAHDILDAKRPAASNNATDK